MKKYLLFIFTLFIAFQSKAAKVNISTDITTNTTWTSNNIYLLQGFIYVKNNATLTIEPGTIIMGEKASKGSLIITRNGKINAQGTSTNPIVFTSDQAPGFRSYGDWGGLIILGNATTNATWDDGTTIHPGVGQIEGGVNNTSNDGLYGGLNDLDNSGVLSYVRIEFPGIAYQPNNEINGLTLGAVGSGTKLDHIQVSYSGDDSYEWFGGTVNCSHIIAFRGWDDEFDCDNGYRGNVQFGIGMRDPNIADQSGSNGFEHDNDAAGSATTPITAPTFSNMTLIGPAVNGTPDANFKRGAHIRRNSRTGIFNSIIVGWPYGIFIDGAGCDSNASQGTLPIRNTYIADMNTKFVGNSTLNVSTWFGTTSFHNDSTKTLANFNFGSTSLSAPDLKLGSGSAGLNKQDYSHTRLQNNFFDTTVNFIGAQGANDNWNMSDGWVNWDPQNTNYEWPVNVNDVNNLLEPITVFPNPTSNILNVLITMSEKNNIALQLTDVSGSVLQVKKVNALNGKNKIEIDTKDMAPGFYLLQIYKEGTLINTNRIIINK